MRNLLALAALLLIGFFGLGWYLDWYRVEKVSSEAGTSSFQIEIDRNKIGEDGRKFIQHGSERIHNALEERKKENDSDSRARTTIHGHEEEAEQPDDGLMKRR
jgi:hypothetical protein